MPETLNRQTALTLNRLDDRVVPTVLDLTTAGAHGELAGGLFAQYDAQPTGTGQIDSFLRIQGKSAQNPTQAGFNTSARPLQYQENKSPQFTRDLPAAAVPAVTLPTGRYREFLLDINQKASQPLLSLDQLKVFVVDAPGLTGYDPTTGKLAGHAPVFDLDADADNSVLLDYRLNHGSGSGDMLFYLPEAALGSGGGYVYVYSKFGEQYASNAGFQEWATRTQQTGAIAGSVFYDADRNGVRDAGEVGYPERTVYLDGNNNGYLDANEVFTYTDANGYYAFEQLAVGDDVGYAVRVSDKPAGDQTTADPPLIFLAPGELRDHVDFGFYYAPPMS
jgi:hypothetical protein